MVFNRASLVVIFRIKVNLLNGNLAWKQACGVRRGGGGVGEGGFVGRECCKKVSVIFPGAPLSIITVLVPPD